ncbi:MAG: hypothetical protein ABJC04_01715 [Verrucomicrobiota bacterium]
MRCRNFIILFCLFAGLFSAPLRAGEYKLTDGQTLIGEPISYSDAGLILKKSDGSFSTRISWGQFTQESLNVLIGEAKTPKDKSIVEAFVEEMPATQEEKKKIELKDIPTPERLTKNVGLSAGFSSPLFLVIFLILYCANIYAAYEIAFYKNQPAGLVCGISAVAPVLGPVIFLCLRANADRSGSQTVMPLNESEVVQEPVISEQPIPAGETIVPAPFSSVPPENSLEMETSSFVSPALAKTAAPPAASAVFNRGEFSFNRRFFETRFAGFLKIVPDETEKNLCLEIKSARGEFSGKRISRITQTELYLQVVKDHVSHDEMIPFSEIQQISVRPEPAT